MRCFLALMAVQLINDRSVQFPIFVNRDLMATVSPRVSDACLGAKAFIIFNGSTPGRCVVETPREVMEKGCVRREGAGE